MMSPELCPELCGTVCALSELFKAPAERNHQVQQAYQAYGYRLREIAQHLGVHYTTVSRWLRKAETHDYKT